MVCPICKAEYREDFLLCKECDAHLVPVLSPATEDATLLLWRGNDPVLFSRLVSDLQAAGIPHLARANANQFTEEVLRPSFSILVLESDAATAQQIVSEILGA